MSWDHVSSAIGDAGIQAEVLNEERRRAVVVRLLERLAIDVTSRFPWEHGGEGKQRSDGWKLIPEFVGSNVCLMFFDGADEILKFQSGQDLLRVLKNCPPLEFYVCDEDASYLLCHNHHDFVVGWGRASQWVERLGNA
ncbi:hypothetical protein [Bradyrhizobium ivorense]|uniref:hypothetical protein n=1 Tax=Bradyrhizobium ivorense TaxID=2511166 RepID=UPI0010BBA4A0|nr:hypothetical protein [Bradyrhizobium ivorense]VIO66769.1 hypothetical protein CI41S_01240 [Bradyrhizobium ivorense]